MTYNDQIYGLQEITEPVILEIINNKAFQRLKGLNQSGLPFPYPRRQNFTRYDHSVGVYLLLKEYGASIEEQIAGLTHDVSHTAFSHALDWVYTENGGDESMQDENHEEYILSTELPTIVQDYGFKKEILTEYKNYKLLERSAPALCADRVDYSLREFEPTIASQILDSLEVHDTELSFIESSSANSFARSYMELQTEHWGGYEALSRFVILAELLKSALKEQFLSHELFWTTDMEVIEVIEQKGHDKIHRLLELLKRPNLDELPISKEKAKKKFRFVDPLVATNGTKLRLTELDPDYAAFLEEQRLFNEEGVQIVSIKGDS